MKINKQQFKALVKECLVEIISEGGLELIPKTYEIRMNGTTTQQSPFMKKMNETIYKQPAAKSKPKTITGDPYLDSLIANAEDGEAKMYPGGQSFGANPNPVMTEQTRIQSDTNVYQMDHVDYSKFSDIFDDDKKFKKAQSNVKPT
jgi:hypothetical protein